VADLEAARAVVPVVSVQNLYNLAERKSEAVLERCQALGIGFIPWFPVASGRLAAPDGPLRRLADETGATPAQLSLAWLLARSPVMVPIPGTSSLEHLEENCAAAGLQLGESQMKELDAVEV